MTDLEDRDYTQFAVQQEAREFLTDYPDLRVSVNDVSAFQGGRRPQTFQVNLAGPDLSKLAEYADELMAEAQGEAAGIVDLDTTLSLRKPEVQVIVDREAASDLGIPVRYVADSLRILVGGMPVTKFRDGGEQYDVWLRARPDDRSIGRGPLRPDAPLADGRPGQALQPRQAQGRARADRDRAAQPPADRHRAGQPRGHPARRGRRTGRRRSSTTMNLPPQYSPVFSGQAKTMAETGYYFVIAFGLSIMFMYLILAAQFESWTQPVSILMALPVTVPFGLLSLVLFRTPMDLYAMFGLFMLVGIVKKNGIFQVDATNQLRGQGHAPARGDRRGEPHPAPADPDDDRDARRGDGPDRPGPRARGRGAGEHGQGDHRRPDALAGPGPAGHAGLLRPARHVGELHPADRHPVLGRAAGRARAARAGVPAIEGAGRAGSPGRSGDRRRRVRRRSSGPGSVIEPGVEPAIMAAVGRPPRPTEDRRRWPIAATPECRQDDVDGRLRRARPAAPAAVRGWRSPSAATHPGKVRAEQRGPASSSRGSPSRCRSASRACRTDGSRRLSEEVGYLLVVADGMGGVAGGEQASALAVETVEDFVLNTLKWFFHLAGRRGRRSSRELRAGLELADRAVIDAAAADPKLARHGHDPDDGLQRRRPTCTSSTPATRGPTSSTTASSQQVTNDHTLVQMLVDTADAHARGRQDAQAPERRDERRRRPDRGGPRRDPQAPPRRRRRPPALLRRPDRAGRRRRRSPPSSAARGRPGGAPPEALVDEACRRGGPDNVTAVVARVHADG